MWSFTNLQYGFKCSHSIADCLLVMVGRIAAVFYISGATKAGEM